MTIIFPNFTVFRDFCTFLKKWTVCTPNSTFKKKFEIYIITNLKYLNKTTFYQIFDCISLKVLDTGSLQLFANLCKSASQLCQKKITKISFHFFGKMSLPQTVYFSISNVWYKLTQPNVHVEW